MLAVAAVTMLRAAVHGLVPLDLPVFAAMSLAMVIVALIASALPARRAASVDPMKVLRAE
jgi:ABC-type lipoprotein release transport system permease subunit